MYEKTMKDRILYYILKIIEQELDPQGENRLEDNWVSFRVPYNHDKAPEKWEGDYTSEEMKMIREAFNDTILKLINGER